VSGDEEDLLDEDKVDKRHSRKQRVSNNIDKES
jgi:hypothetical protein